LAAVSELLPANRAACPDRRALLAAGHRSEHRQLTLIPDPRQIVRRVLVCRLPAEGLAPLAADRQRGE
jgi:hypothetical protein